MSNFYLSDLLVLNELKLQDEDFRIYQHCCKQFNVKSMKSYIRLVDIAGQFQLSLEQVQHSLARMTRIRIQGLPLIKISEGPKYLIFDMPRHKEFIKQIGFMKFNSSKGWKVLRETITKVASDKIYKFPNLDMYQLQDHLAKMPDEELNKLKEEDLLYGWILKNEKKHRKNN